jgi:hypothetical protein
MKIINSILLATYLLSCRPQSIQYPSNSMDAGPPVEVSLLGLPEVPEDAYHVSPPRFGYQPNEVVTPLVQGTPAPYNGLIFNGPAIARVTVEFRAVQQRCAIEREHDRNLFQARYDADVATLRLAMETQERNNAIILQNREETITNLHSQLENTNSSPRITENLLWGAGGLAIGIILVGGIVVYANTN